MCLASCSELANNGFQGQSSNTKDDEDESGETKNTAPDRPSETGEGVPGYLVDPESIAFASDGKSLEIVAPAGTFIEGTKASYIHVVGVDEKNLPTKSSQRKINVTWVGTIGPKLDGSFSGEFDFDQEHLALLMVKTHKKKFESTSFKNEASSGSSSIAVDLKGSGQALDLESYMESLTGEPLPEEPKDQATCNLGSRYWDRAVSKCTEKDLVDLENCKSGNEDLMEDMLDNIDDLDKDEFSDLTDSDAGYRIGQCFYTTDARDVVAIELTKDSKVRFVEYTSEQLKGHITP